MTQLRWQMHVGFAVESSGWGVAATAPAMYLPVSKCDFQDEPKFYYDEAYRSVQAKDFGAFLATLQGKWSVDADLYVNTDAPLMLGVGMIGDNDVVTTVNGSVLNLGWSNLTTGIFAHTFGIQPNGPKSLTLFDYNGYSERAYQGARIEQVQLKYTPEAQVSLAINGISRLSVLVTGSFVPSIDPTFTPIMAWQAKAFLNGAQTTRVIDTDLTFKRAGEALFTQAQTQSPTNIYVFPMEIDGKMTVDFVDETEYNYFRTNNQSAQFQLFFVASSTQAISFTVPQPVFTSYVVDRGKDALTATINFRGIYNQANSSNVTMVVYNNVSAAY